VAANRQPSLLKGAGILFLALFFILIIGAVVHARTIKDSNNVHRLFGCCNVHHVHTTSLVRPMSSILSSKCPTNVLQWRHLAEKWAKQTKVPTALILAFIDQESDGNYKCIRVEKSYCQKLLNTPAGKRKLDEIHRATGLNYQDIVTSYGLMQPLFMLSWGYGSKHIADLYDPDSNIRYCSAHIATLMSRYKGDMQSVAGAYNGAGRNSKYATDVMKLYAKYKSYLERGV
jgi:hypothetical protein